MRDDYAIAADLCEEHGLVEPARVLRQIAERSCGAFMVRPDELNIPLREGTEPLLVAATQTRRLFLNRAAAERYAAHLAASLLRELLHHSWEREFLFRVPEEEFAWRVGVILQAEYRIPNDSSTPLIPAWASDEQLGKIAKLLRESYFEVVGVSIDPGEEQS